MIHRDIELGDKGGDGELELYMSLIYRRSIEVAIEQALLVRFKDISSVNIDCSGETCLVSAEATTATKEEIMDFIKELQSQFALVKTFSTFS
jgi:hypothetical protein